MKELQIWNKKQREGNKRTSSHKTVKTKPISSSSESSDSSLIDLDTDEEDFGDCNFTIKEIKVLDIKPFDPFLSKKIKVFSFNYIFSTIRMDLVYGLND